MVIHLQYPAWIFASISTRLSAGIISSGIGTRSWMGIPWSTMASCFMLGLSATFTELEFYVLGHAEHLVNLGDTEPVENLFVLVMTLVY